MPNIDEKSSPKLSEMEEKSKMTPLKSLNMTKFVTSDHAAKCSTPTDFDRGYQKGYKALYQKLIKEGHEQQKRPRKDSRKQLEVTTRRMIRLLDDPSKQEMVKAATPLLQLWRSLFELDDAKAKEQVELLTESARDLGVKI